MKKLLILLLLLASSAFVAYAQDPLQKTFVFDGYILSTDSVPIEGAYLINYRDSKITATDYRGYFKMMVEKGDSVMINHVSMAPKVVQVYPTYIDKAEIIIDYRTYMVNPITTYDEERQKTNLERSMEQLNEDIKEQVIVDPTKRTGNENTYNENEANPGATIIRVSPTVSKKDKMDKRNSKP